MRQFTEASATQDLVHATVLDTELGGRFAVTLVTPQQGGIVVTLLAIENSDHYVKGEERDLFVSDRPADVAFNRNFVIED